MRPVRLVSGILTVGFWTLASRVLGVVREMLILGLIGPGPVLDAFVAAFRLPNMFRRFFAEGAFNAAFVPIFSKKLEGREGAQAFASEAFTGLGFVLLVLTLLALVLMPALVWATAEGFRGDARFALTVEYGRVLFVSLAALCSGVLNAAGRFAAAAAAPVLLNIFVIAAMAAAAWTRGPVVVLLVWAIPAAGVAQLGLVWIAAARAGIRLRPGRPRLTPDLKRLTRVAIPAALAGGVMQINLLVGQQVASHFDKAVGWLYAADRLYQLPLGVVGIAVGIVLLPDLSRRLKAGDDAGARAAFSRAGEIALALTVPAAVALMVVPLPLVSVLFERGATGPDDSAAIAAAVAIYGLGLPAFMLQKLLQPLYFAREDTTRPFRYALVAMVVNAALAVGLAPALGWLATALAATIAAWAMVVLLAVGARSMGDVARFDPRLRGRIWRICLASAAMGALLWAGNLALGPALGTPLWRIPALAVLIGFGLGSYFLLGQAVGAFRWTELRRALRRR